MRVDISNAELHNIVKRKGGLEVRKGLVVARVATYPAKYVAGFSVESPFTTEVWHYLFEQDATTSVVTLRVYTEDFVEMFTHDLGALDRNPVITHAVANNQIMINSPSFSTPLYGLVGGGIIPAVKTESDNIDTTALDIPTGHTCSFGDRTAIAQGNVVYFNDASLTADPRTFVSLNANPLAGTIYDIFQGDDGALYMFTSAGVFYMAQDAIGKGQEVAGFIGMIPGLQVTKPRNAAASNGVVAVLQRGGIAILGGKNQVIDIAPYKGPRTYSRAVEIDDYRLSGQIYATAEGFIVGFRGSERFFLDFNLREGYRSYVWPLIASSSFNIVGCLRSSENDTLLVDEDYVYLYQGNADDISIGGANTYGVAAIDVDVPEGLESLVRHVVVSSDNAGQVVSAMAGHTGKTETCPTKSSDTVIGTTEWGTTINGRRFRNTRLSFSERMTNIPLEIAVTGPTRRIEAGVDVRTKGQGKRRGDKR